MVVTSSRARFPTTGEFDIPVEPGVWSVSVGLDSGGQRTYQVWSRRVPIGGVEEDILLSGMRLCGRVFDASTRTPVSRSIGDLEVRARPAQGGTHSSELAAHVDSDGSYVIDMIGSGDWILTTSPLGLDAPGETISVRLLETEIEHRLDLTVRKP
jgi:hypothetical protein